MALFPQDQVYYLLYLVQFWEKKYYGLLQLLQIQRFSFFKFLKSGINQVFENVNPIVVTNRKYIFYSKYYLIKIPSQTNFRLENYSTFNLNVETKLSFIPCYSYNSLSRNSLFISKTKNYKKIQWNKNQNIIVSKIENRRKKIGFFHFPNKNLWSENYLLFKINYLKKSIPQGGRTKWSIFFSDKLGKSKSASAKKLSQNCYPRFFITQYKILKNTEIPIVSSTESLQKQSNFFLIKSRQLESRNSIKKIGFSQNFPSLSLLDNQPKPVVSLQTIQTKEWKKKEKKKSLIFSTFHTRKNRDGSAASKKKKKKNYSYNNLTYSSEFYIPVQITDQISKKMYLRWLLLADLLIQTKRGHFIVNGYPKTVIHQIVRSPGIRFKNENNQILADIISIRGAWMGIQIVYEKISKFSGTLQKTMKHLSETSVEEILKTKTQKKLKDQINKKIEKKKPEPKDIYEVIFKKKVLKRIKEPEKISANKLLTVNSFPINLFFLKLFGHFPKRSIAGISRPVRQVWSTYKYVTRMPTRERLVREVTQTKPKLLNNRSSFLRTFFHYPYGSHNEKTIDTSIEHLPQRENKLIDTKLALKSIEFSFFPSFKDKISNFNNFKKIPKSLRNSLVKYHKEHYSLFYLDLCSDYWNLFFGRKTFNKISPLYEMIKKMLKLEKLIKKKKKKDDDYPVPYWARSKQYIERFLGFLNESKSIYFLPKLNEKDFLKDFLKYMKLIDPPRFIDYVKNRNIKEQKKNLKLNTRNKNYYFPIASYQDYYKEQELTPKEEYQLKTFTISPPYQDYYKEQELTPKEEYQLKTFTISPKNYKVPLNETIHKTLFIHFFDSYPFSKPKWGETPKKKKRIKVSGFAFLSYLFDHPYFIYNNYNKLFESSSQRIIISSYKNLPLFRPFSSKYYSNFQVVGKYVNDF